MCPSVYLRTYVCMCVRCVQLFITYSRLLYAVVVDAVMCIHVTDCRCVQSLNCMFVCGHMCVQVCIYSTLKIFIHAFCMCNAQYSTLHHVTD